MKENRPEMFITYAYDDTDALVLDSSGSLEDARKWARQPYYRRYHDAVIYRVERIRDGEYGNEQFIEKVWGDLPEVRR